MAATLAELEARVDILASRIAKLATTEQVTNLQSLVSGWKNDHYDAITELQTEVRALKVRVNDLESRVQTLEP